MGDEDEYFMDKEEFEAEKFALEQEQEYKANKVLYILKWTIIIIVCLPGVIVEVIDYIKEEYL